MAVAFDAASATWVETAGALTITVPLTIGASANAIAVFLIDGSSGSGFPPALTVVLDPLGVNQAFTQIPGTLRADGTLPSNGAIYGLLAPAATGNKNIVITWTTTSSEMHAAAISFTGVDQTSVAVAFPNGTNAAGAATTTSSVTVTTAVGDIPIACHAENIGNFTATNGTQIANLPNTGPNLGVAANRGVGAAGTVTLTATISASGNFDAYGCNVKAAAGGGDTLGNSMQTLMMSRQKDQKKVWVPGRRIIKPRRALLRAA